MLNREHVIYVDCDYEECHSMINIGAPTYAACLTELRQAGWQVGRTLHFCPAHRDRPPAARRRAAAESEME